MKNLIVTITTGIICLLVGFAFGKFSETSQQINTSQKQIIVGLDDAYPPIGFRDDQGNIVGFDIDLAKVVFAKLGYEPVFKPVDWEGVILTLQNKEIDVVWNGMTITESRKEQIAFSNPYIFSNDIFIVNRNEGITAVNDLIGKTIAVQAGSSQADAIATAAIADKVSIKTYSSNDEACLDLKSGRVSALLADGYSGRYYLTTIGEAAKTFTSIDAGFEKSYAGVGIRKEDTSLRNEINTALNELINNGTASAISTKWFGEDIIVK